MIFWLLKIIFFIPLLIVFPARVIGRKNLVKKGRVILAPNHQTLNDPIFLALHLFRRFNFMAKSPLFEKKFKSSFLRQLGAFPVHTSSSDIASVKKTLRLLNDDKALCIFPEGRRIKTEESNQLKNGVVMFALKTKSPINPAFFMKKTNAFVFNTIIIGKPIYLYEMEEFKDKKIDKELLEKASLVLSKAIHNLK
jgi:1-acyl-sn-glycerol-3-phosphate acyltransferase